MAEYVPRHSGRDALECGKLSERGTHASEGFMRLPRGRRTHVVLQTVLSSQRSWTVFPDIQSQEISFVPSGFVFLRQLTLLCFVYSLSGLCGIPHAGLDPSRFIQEFVGRAGKNLLELISDPRCHTKKRPRLTKYNVSDCICRIVEPLNVNWLHVLHTLYLSDLSFVAAFFIGHPKQVDFVLLEAPSLRSWLAFLLALGLTLVGGVRKAPSC